MQPSAMQPSAMQPREFAAYHLPALERDEAKHNLIVAVLGRLASENHPSCSGGRSASRANARSRRRPIRSFWAT